MKDKQNQKKKQKCYLKSSKQTNEQRKKIII